MSPSKKVRAENVVLEVVIEEPVIKESFWVVLRVEMKVEAFS
jgi:hypothetical protein